MNTKELLQSVDRASLISRDGHDNVIKWSIHEQNVTITSAAQGVGSVNEELTGQIDGPSLTISFNARYMIEALRSIDEEQVKIHFTGAMTPFTIKPLQNADSLHLIVPIRTR
jgi:DNA polymerase-3 subunit beta